MRNRSWRDVRAENVKGRVRFVIPHHEIGPADQKPPYSRPKAEGCELRYNAKLTLRRGPPAPLRWREGRSSILKQYSGNVLRER